MKPYNKVSSFRGANTLFQGQQNEGRTDEETHRDKERREERSQTQITVGRSEKTRSQEIQG
jgi:hypothetical protein